jgi:hypothetical protein
MAPPFTPDELAAEEWRLSPSFPRYLVSSLGRYKWADPTAKWGRKGIRSGNYDGRYMLGVFTGGRKRVTRAVHILVAEAFLGPRPEGLWVCHWDDDGQNNRLSNLRYATPLDNSADAKRNGSITNRVDDFAHLLGNTPDSEIAKLAGCVRQLVAQGRAARGIAAMGLAEAERWRRDRAVAPVVDRLGSAPDAVLAREAGVPLCTITLAREDRGIPAFVGPTGPGSRGNKVAPFTHLLGVLTDTEIARMAGTVPPVVCMFRQRLGIPARSRRAA